MDRDKLRTTLDQMDEDELLALRDEVNESPDGSLHDIAGVEVDKDKALMFINQAMVMDNS